MILDEMLKNVNGGKISDDDYIDLFLYILDCNEEGWDVDQSLSLPNAGMPVISSIKMTWAKPSRIMRKLSDSFARTTTKQAF
ncbi:MAG: hypothetical protein IJH00_01140 [Erysipelotrichaceae bacterium]|nr:hypothetical protein [Erysipelotrichaceae bacterium]